MPAFITAMSDDTFVEVPAWVIDNASFLRWAESDDAPDKGKISYLQGTVRINPEMEQLFHNEIKAAITESLRLWSRTHGLGKCYTDGMVYTNEEADFTTVPDGIFLSTPSLEDGLAELDKGKRSTKITGSADIVVEVVSRSSAQKDLVQLRESYHDASVKEYWVVDSRMDDPKLMILEWTKRGYRSVKADDGWVRSKVLGGSFKLMVDDDQVELLVK